MAGWTGLALLLAGLSLLGYVAWQLWGTSYVSRQRQHDAVQGVERFWRGAPRGPAGGPTGGATALARIPRFGDDCVMAGARGHR